MVTFSFSKHFVSLYYTPRNNGPRGSQPRGTCTLRNFQASVVVERLWGGDLTVQTLVGNRDAKCIHLANIVFVAVLVMKNQSTSC